MPYGFTKDRLREGIKASTIKFQVIVVEQFFDFLRLKYKRDISPNEITIKDVREFLDEQKYKLNLKDGTIYRKQSNLKVFFNYLWKKNIISHDIMAKFNYFDNKHVEMKSNREINYDYEFLLEQEQKVLNSKLPDTSKLLMLLYIKGIEVSDMYNLTVSNVEILKDKAEIRYVSQKTGKDILVEYFDDLEIALLEDMVRRAILRDTPYLIHSKNKDDNYSKSKPTITRFYMEEINKLIGINLRSDDVRITYVDYLYRKEKLSIGEIAKLLGRNYKYVANLLELAAERMYNQKSYSDDYAIKATS